MVSTNRFIAYTDPAHGWLAVTDAQLEAVEMTPRDFSAYSYRGRSGNLFYLEEDCDAPKFLREHAKRYGEVAIDSVHTDAVHPIRSLERIK